MSATVHLSSDIRRFSDGQGTVSAEGATISAVIADLDRRFPGLGERLSNQMAVVLDGVVIAHPQYEPVGDGAEIYFIHRTSGG